MEICITIHGRRHCFPVPLLIEKIHLPGPGPVNYPELELAIAVLQLVKVVEPHAAKSQLTKQLGEVATQFIQQVQKGLPQGVELKQVETPKRLPKEKLIQAARTAVEVNPLNHPPLQRLTRVLPDFIATPERIAVITTKYWGVGGVRLTVGFLDNAPADLRKRILL